MSESNINLVDSFRDNCLVDLRAKQESLITLQQTAIKQIHESGEHKIQQLSKVLVDLEDSVVSQLRVRCQQILLIEQRMLSEQLHGLEQFLKQRMIQQSNHINKMIATIESNSEKSQKMLGKIAAGKIQHEFKQFTTGINNLRVVPCQLIFDHAQIIEIVEDIVETLNTKYSKYNPPEQHQSERYENVSNSTLISKSKTQVKDNPSKLMKEQIKNVSGVSSKNFVRNQSAISKNIEYQAQTQYCGPSGVDEYKSSKAIRRARKLEQRTTYKQHSPQKDVDNLIRLALEKKRLLKQLESG